MALKVASIRIESEQHKAIAAYAKANGLNVSQLSRKLFSEVLKNEESSVA